MDKIRVISFVFLFSEYSTTNTGYWTGTSTESAATKHIKPHNKRYSKVNVPVRVSTPLLPPVAIETATTTLDANKRKQLPAWIREGATFVFITVPIGI